LKARSPHLRYIAAVPPCFDVYVWLHPDDRAGVLSRFIDR